MRYWDPIGLNGSHPGPRASVFVSVCVPEGAGFQCRTGIFRGSVGFGTGQAAGTAKCENLSDVEKLFETLRVSALHARVHCGHHRCCRRLMAIVQHADCGADYVLARHGQPSPTCSGGDRSTAAGRQLVCHANRVRASTWSGRDWPTQPSQRTFVFPGMSAVQLIHGCSVARNTGGEDRHA